MKNWPKLTYLIIILGIITGLSSSCLKQKNYPVIPHIEFKNIIYSDTMANIIISFTDGDGDIGNFKEDSLTKNLFVEYYELRKGVWYHVPPDSIPVPYHFIVPNITPNSKNKTLEGEIDIEMFSYFDPTNPFDTVKYTVQLFDRAKNPSNIVETNTIIVNK